MESVQSFEVLSATIEESIFRNEALEAKKEKRRIRDKQRRLKLLDDQSEEGIRKLNEIRRRRRERDREKRQKLVQDQSDEGKIKLLNIRIKRNQADRAARARRKLATPENILIS